MITTDDARLKSRELLKWFRSNGLGVDDVVPICALTAGAVIRIQALTAPPDEFPAYLDEGIEAACGMLQAAAMAPVRQ